MNDEMPRFDPSYLLSLSDRQFELLSIDEKEAALKSLVEAGFAEGQQHNNAPAELAYYERAAVLGEARFWKLSPNARMLVLVALLCAGNTEGQQSNNSPAALAYYERAVALGEARFWELRADAQHLVLGVLLNAGNTEGQLSNNAPAELAYYERAVALGEARFWELRADAQEQVLKALANAGITEREQPNNAPAEMAYYERAAALGETRFWELSAVAQSYVLQALVNAGTIEGQQSNNAPAELAYYERAVASGEAGFGELSADSQTQVLNALVYANSRLGANKARAQAITTSALAWAWPKDGDPNVLFFTSLKIRNIPIEAYWQASFNATSWLTGFINKFIKPDRPQQRRMMLNILEGLASDSLHADLNFIKRLVHQLSMQGSGWESLCRIASRALCQKNDWPIRFNRLNQWLFAILYCVDPKACPSATSIEWNPDVAHCMRVMRAKQMILEGGEVRSPSYWTSLLPTAQLQAWRLEETGNDSNELKRLLLAWREGDAAPMHEALIAGWRSLAVTCQCIDKDKRSSLSECLATWGVNDPDLAVWEASIYANADTVVAQHMESWINKRLGEAADATAYAEALNEVVARFATAYSTSRRDTKILEQLHAYSLAEIEANPEDTVILWHRLEAARVALASASQQAQQHTLQPDDEANLALQTATTAELQKSELMFEQAQRGKICKTPLDHDIVLEPFATLGQQMQRLGYTLNLVTPKAAADLLSREPTQAEYLVQLWWDNSGTGRALWLDASAQLASISLTPTLALSAWEELLDLWDVALQLHRDDPENSQAIAEATNPWDLIQNAWDAMVRPDSPALALLNWLAQTAQQRSATNASGAQARPKIVLLLPARFARLPWLALFSKPDGVDLSWLLGQLELAVSISAWSHTRRRSAVDDEAAEDKHAAGQVLIAGDLQSEEMPSTDAQHVAEQLRAGKPIVGGLVEVLRALQAPGHTHLVMHGEFYPFDPLKSSLKLGNHELSAQLLSGCAISGDVSMVSCEGLLVGDGETSYLGAAGIGPILSASGARSVMGPIWQAHQLASRLFNAFWFEARSKHSASTALNIAQQRLRTMTADELLSWVEDYAPTLRKIAENRIRTSKKYRQITPFAPAYYWACYTLLGDAPPLPALRVRWREMILAWIRRLWRRQFSTRRTKNFD